MSRWQALEAKLSMGWASGEVVLPEYPGDWVLVEELSFHYKLPSYKRKLY